VLLLEGGTLKRAQIFSQEQESRVNLRERGESSRNESQGVGGGLFIAPTTKRAVGRLFNRQVQ
jgi:hypothetical protein